MTGLRLDRSTISWLIVKGFRKDSLGSLSNNVFERRTSTGSDLFSFFDGGFAQIFSQIASIIVKKLRNTNFISSRHVKRENTSLPVDVRRSKTSLLKLPIGLQRQLRRQRKRLKNDVAVFQTLGVVASSNGTLFSGLILAFERLFHIVIRSSKYESFLYIPIHLVQNWIPWRRNLGDCTQA